MCCLHLVPSSTTPISLINHAAAAERIWFQQFRGGLDAAACDGYAQDSSASRMSELAPVVVWGSRDTRTAGSVRAS
ncbi:DUF664 domain-containing protein [Gordonia polyisoprenivorans]|uniref:mycothiol transferase n=1 Tax=Gordonia polyisoprenivorans TaxID=84595 RepID=UPI003CC81357